MAQLEHIAGPFERSAQSIGHVDAQLRAAIGHAGNIVGQLANLGFQGVAERVSQVQQKLAQVGGILPIISQEHDRALQVIGQIGVASTPEQVIGQLSTVETCAAAIEHGIGAVVTHLDEAQAITMEALQGGAPEDLIRIIAVALEYAQESHRAMNLARQGVADQIAAARNLGK